MKPVTIFITYNPKVESEQVLAVRLHTIGAVNGFRMFLPDRNNSDKILDAESKRRIEESDFLIFFALSSKISSIVQQEIDHAFRHFNNKSKIIVIHDKRLRINGQKTVHFTKVGYDPLTETPNQIIERAINTVADSNKQEELKELKRENRRLLEDNSTKNAIIALLGIGLGLAILANLSRN